MTSTPAGRAPLRYLGPDAGVVALHGDGNPIPRHVDRGDVFEVDAAVAASMVAGPRFERADGPPPSPYADLTKAEIVDLLDLDASAADRMTKAELLDLADAAERDTPTPNGTDTEGTNR